MSSPRPSLTLHGGRDSLPRGPHALPSEEVAASQRGRMLQAVAEVVAVKGYHATTVSDIIGRARVSRGAFYALYADKEQAYLAAYAIACEQVMHLVDRAYEHQSDWLQIHRAAIDAYLAAYMQAPAYAWSFNVEVRGAGPAAREMRDHVMDRYAALIGRTARAARAGRGLPELPHSVLFGITSVADELVSREIREGRLDRLDALATPLLHLHLSAIVGPEFAAERAPLDPSAH